MTAQRAPLGPPEVEVPFTPRSEGDPPRDNPDPEPDTV